MKTWHRITAQADGAAQIDIFDDIGYYGVTARDFINELKALSDVKTIDLRINSHGGDLFEASPIYNA